MIDWNDLSPLTRSEFDIFIGAAIPFLKNMEAKNGWDFFVNDIRFNWFCERFLIEAFELADYEDEQECNTKVRDLSAIYDILVEADWTAENEALRNNPNSEIWKLVLNRVNAIADSIF